MREFAAGERADKSSANAECARTFDGMASKGLRTAFASTVTEVDAGANASQTTEILICYTVCCAVVLFLSVF